MTVLNSRWYPEIEEGVVPTVRILRRYVGRINTLLKILELYEDKATVEAVKTHKRALDDMLTAMSKSKTGDKLRE